MKRIFIAVKIIPNEKTLTSLQNIKIKLQNERIRWVNHSNLHLTLKFLGDTEEVRITEIYNSLKKYLPTKIPEFSYQLKGIGLFKSIYRPRVIWMGINQSKIIENLHFETQYALQRIGFTNDNNNFSPHLTIGRMKLINNTQILHTIVSNYKETVFQEIEVTKISIYESILQKTGPIYNELFGIELI